MNELRKLIHEKCVEESYKCDECRKNRQSTALDGICSKDHFKPYHDFINKVKEKVTILNIDDIIRSEKRRCLEIAELHNIKKIIIHWGKREFKILRKFTASNYYFGVHHILDTKIKSYTTEIEI